jgi:hypothetical protein
MTDKLKNIATISITDTEFEEENDGVIIIKSFGKTKIGLGVSQRNNGDAELWFNVNEAKEVVAALENAMNELNDSDL